MKILVLGATGMLGHTLFRYLQLQFPQKVFGTSRTKEDELFTLQVETIEKNLLHIFSILKKVDYIINCIGLLPNTKDEEKLFEVNGCFPKALSLLGEKYNYKFIHMSTDAVFSNLAGLVTEKDRVNPDSIYGRSKLTGEPNNKNSLSIRDSLLGLDSRNHRGLLEWAMTSKGEINGYTNQLWSGATTLQIAMLCEKIIKKNAFKNLRSRSPVFHFAPIKNITKYDVLFSFFQVSKRKKIVHKTEDVPITRQLISNFEKELWFDDFTHDINNALQELLTFEKMNQ